MNDVLASIKISEEQTITGTHRSIEHEGELYIIFSTTDQDALAALKLDRENLFRHLC